MHLVLTVLVLHPHTHTHTHTHTHSVRHGPGIQRYATLEERYEGQWAKGRRHGFGKQFYLNDYMGRTLYEGDWYVNLDCFKSYPAVILRVRPWCDFAVASVCNE